MHIWHILISLVSPSSVIALNPDLCIYNLSMSIRMPRTPCTLRWLQPSADLALSLWPWHPGNFWSEENRERGKESGHGSTSAARRLCCRPPSQDDISRIQRWTELWESVVRPCECRLGLPAVSHWGWQVVKCGTMRCFWPPSFLLEWS
jgi:hypothetical protein